MFHRRVSHRRQTEKKEEITSPTSHLQHHNDKLNKRGKKGNWHDKEKQKLREESVTITNGSKLEKSEIWKEKGKIFPNRTHIQF